MPKCVLHVIDQELTEIKPLRELMDTVLWLQPSIVQFCTTANPGDVFHMQTNEHFVALGASVVAPWLEGAS